MTSRVHAVVTGGGTSGHVVPAIAILESLVDAGHDADSLRYVGAERGVETSLLPATPFPATYLAVSGLRRSFAPRALAANLVLPLRVVRARRHARTLLRAWEPRVVVSVGGYASDPMAHAAVRSGVPLVCVSYDRAPGLATRRQASRATTCAVAFADSDLPRAVHTGAPVRRVLRTLDREATRSAAREALGIDAGARTVAIVGGSLGSATLNSASRRILEECGRRREEGPFAVLHVCGDRYAAEPLPDVPTGVTYRRRGYEPRMDLVYAACDLLVARAGASTVAEVAVVGAPSVLVPWPGAANGHQLLNARWMGDAGGAVVMDDAEILAPTGAGAIVDLLADAGRLADMATKARAAGVVHRSDALVRVIDDAAR